MRAVLDTSAIIYLQDFRKFEEIFIPPSVKDEIKDRLSRMKLETLEPKIVEPEENFVKEIKTMAKRTGDLERLSETDVQVLALAKQVDAIIVSDDYNIQNVAKKLGIKYLSVFSKGIKKLYFWEKYCPNCKKYFKRDLKECPVCGAGLKRLPKGQGRNK
ncbi:MAG: PIN domain-containing protein [Candidatus Aenigmatarchaeota archaeon]